MWVDGSIYVRKNCRETICNLLICLYVHESVSVSSFAFMYNLECEHCCEYVLKKIVLGEKKMSRM